MDMHKYISGIYQVKHPQFTMATHSETQSNSNKIFMTFTRTEVRSSFLSERVVADWNSLPVDVVTTSSVSCFKACFDAVWKNLQSVLNYYFHCNQMPSRVCSSECCKQVYDLHRCRHSS